MKTVTDRSSLDLNLGTRLACQPFTVSKYALVILVCLCSNTTSALAADCIGVQGATSVVLRASPAATSAARGTIRPGDLLPLIASLPGWYQTSINGTTVFAAKRVTNLAPCPAAPLPVSTGTTFEIHAIDVGTGLSILVRGPDFALLYDAGSNDDLARGDDNRTIAYLKTLQPPLERINHVVLSHPHRDHVELLPDVVSRFKPTGVWNSGAFNNICGYRNFLLAIAANPSVQYHTATEDGGSEEAVKISAKDCYGVQQPEQTVSLKHASRIVTDEKIALGEGASMTFLFVDGSKHPDFNQNSLVVRLDLGQHRILLMGDAEAGDRKPPSTPPLSTEGALLACCLAEIKAEVLVAGHHGSMTSSRAAFITAVGAKIFVVSAGPTKYGKVVLPDDVIMAELKAQGDVFRTDLDDDTCAMSSDKVGPKADGKAGGCDNVLVTIPTTGPVTAEYRRP